MTDISKTLRNRWSPRGYDPTAVVTEDQVTALLEAARWAPSAYNHQPWKLIVGVRGDETYAKLQKNLIFGGE